jgi:hypothetical protein
LPEPEGADPRATGGNLRSLAAGRIPDEEPIVGEWPRLL